MHKHSIIIDDKTFTRNSKSRRYTHVVVIDEGTADVGVFAWSSRKALAEKKAKSLRNATWADGKSHRITIHEVTYLTKAPVDGYAEFLTTLKPGQSLSLAEYNELNASIKSSRKA